LREVDLVAVGLERTCDDEVKGALAFGEERSGEIGPNFTAAILAGVSLEA
jgi:hypothetical protein